MTSKQQTATAKAKPPNAGKGRKKGTPNKVTGEVKAMVLAALDGAGGVEYLIECAQDPRARSAFLTLVGKVIPTQITGEGGGPLTTIHRIELVGVAPK